jgi:SOS-response transcriptional repressor LexA
MVLGQSMVPEFNEGDIVIIEPEGQLKDGCFVLARSRSDGPLPSKAEAPWEAALHAQRQERGGDMRSQGEWTMRQLLRRQDHWLLHALNPAFPDEPLASLSDVRGVIIQKAIPGRRKASKSYV